jgi:hypothetical protein
MSVSRFIFHEQKETGRYFPVGRSPCPNPTDETEVCLLTQKVGNVSPIRMLLSSSIEKSFLNIRLVPFQVLSTV